MKKIFALLITHIFLITINAQTGSVGIGTINPNNSAALDIQSTSKGVLIPRMTSVQRNAIASPATGLLIYDNTTNSFWFRGAADWIELTDTLNNVWRKNGNNAYVNVPDNVGIGTSTPQFHLDINKPNASIGFTDAQLNQFSGSIAANAGNLTVNALRVFLGQGTPGNLLLQTNSGFTLGGNVGIGTSAPEYKLDVSGGDIRAQQNLLVSQDVSVGQNLTVANNKGILRSGNSNQLVIVFPSGQVNFTNAPPGFNADVTFSMPIVFGGLPLVSVCQALNQTGSYSQWILTIHSVEEDQFVVRFHNAGSTNSTMSALYRFTAIGVPQQ